MPPRSQSVAEPKRPVSKQEVRGAKSAQPPLTTNEVETRYSYKYNIKILIETGSSRILMFDSNL